MDNQKNKSKTGWEIFEIIINAIAQLAVPILVVVIPIFLSKYQTKQQESAIEQKVVDNFYKNISSDNPEQQNLAVGALKMVKQELAVRLAGNLTGLNAERKLNLAKSIVADETQSEKVKIETRRIIEDLAKDETQPPTIRTKALDIIRRTPRVIPER